MEKQEKPLKMENRLARSTTMNAVKRTAEGVRCHAQSVTSLGTQTHIPITASAVAGSKSKQSSLNIIKVLLLFAQIRLIFIAQSFSFASPFFNFTRPF